MNCVRFLASIVIILTIWTLSYCLYAKETILYGMVGCTPIQPAHIRHPQQRRAGAHQISFLITSIHLG